MPRAHAPHPKGTRPPPPPDPPPPNGGDEVFLGAHVGVGSRRRSSLPIIQRPSPSRRWPSPSRRPGRRLPGAGRTHTLRGGAWPTPLFPSPIYGAWTTHSRENFHTRQSGGCEDPSSGGSQHPGASFPNLPLAKVTSEELPLGCSQTVQCFVGKFLHLFISQPSFGRQSERHRCSARTFHFPPPVNMHCSTVAQPTDLSLPALHTHTHTTSGTAWRAPHAYACRCSLSRSVKALN